MSTRWTGMIAGLATPLRVVLVLLLFALGATSHDAAMAQSPMAGDMLASAMSMDITADAGPLHHHTGHPSTHRGMPEPGCCVMGQCLIGIPPTPFLELAAPGKPEQAATSLMVSIGSPSELPYRPPTLV
jgi:hypothetical protein